MKLRPKPRIKTCDLHIRLSPKNHNVLKKISMLKDTTITNVIEEYISILEKEHLV
jgi:hypothetical protein